MRTKRQATLPGTPEHPERDAGPAEQNGTAQDVRGESPVIGKPPDPPGVDSPLAIVPLRLVNLEKPDRNTAVQAIILGERFGDGQGQSGKVTQLELIEASGVVRIYIDGEYRIALRSWETVTALGGWRL